LIFVCHSSRAVHIELLADTNSAAFFDCLIKFSERRGLPEAIYCDQATNFLGVSNLFKTPKFPPKNFVWANVKWHFVPASALHFSGLAEAAVKSCKMLLKRSVGKSRFTILELSTLATIIEGLLNSRPLCYFRDSDEGIVLTPGHL
jgi:hypothetical protein